MPPAAGMSASARVTSSLKAARVLIFRTVAGIPDMTLKVVSFVAMEVVEGLFIALRERSVVSVTGVIAVIDMTVEAARTVEPGACADEDSACEPIRAVIAVRGAVVRREIVVAVRAYGRGTDADVDLCGCDGGAA